MDRSSSKPTETVAEGRVEHATFASFDQQVLTSSAPVLVDFYADWCGSCQTQGRILHNFVPQLKDVKIVEVDVDENAALARRFGITALPTLLIIQDGKVTGKQVGLATEKQLRSVFANYLIGDDRQQDAIANVARP